MKQVRSLEMEQRLSLEGEHKRDISVDKTMIATDQDAKAIKVVRLSEQLNKATGGSLSQSSTVSSEKPVLDPYRKAIIYMERHNILQVFQNMTVSIIHREPKNPVDFMISEIEELKKQLNSKK